MISAQMYNFKPSTRPFSFSTKALLSQSISSSNKCNQQYGIHATGMGTAEGSDNLSQPSLPVFGFPSLATVSLQSGFKK